VHLGDYFHDQGGPEARAAVARVAAALGVRRSVALPGAAGARAAAFVISNAEGAALHLDDLRTRAADFEPLSRDRFLAGALLPAAWVQQAQRVRRRFALQAAELFRDIDVLVLRIAHQLESVGVVAAPVAAMATLAASRGRVSLHP
jgi:Asp-tRNA(Asn)/Glu-tRNA(Gln) amidotransferase A subunit family amidase